MSSSIWEFCSKNNSMKIALAQLNYYIGDFELNISRICDAIRWAQSEHADLVIFAELSVCGYPPRDFLEFDDFINRAENAVQRIAESCVGIAAIVGAPSVNKAEKGKPLFNTAFFLAEGKIQSMVHKTLLPNYDVFDEYRYFEPNHTSSRVINYKEFSFAMTICEDLWNVVEDPLYISNPMDELIGQAPDAIINIAASPFHYNQPELRREVLCKNALRYKVPVFYVNHVGGQTELLFDGSSMVLDRTGSTIYQLKSFEEDRLLVDFVTLSEQPPLAGVTPQQGPSASTGSSNGQYPLPVHPTFSAKVIPLIHDALVMGIRDYFCKMGFTRAILGLSGGIDSAVTLVLASSALGPGNVKAILLPSQFSSEHSVADAKKSAENLGVPYEIIPIIQAYQAMESTLKEQFKGLPFNLTEENIQARIRAVILMALSNKFGYILLNTSNKSEAAVGYGTLYGDMCGGLSVLGDIYKTQIYQLASYLNRDSEVIPLNTISKPPSAELRPGQKDSDSLPEYGLLDEILFLYIEKRKGPDELIALGFDESVVRRVLQMVNVNEYKRYQTPPILRVSPKAFGMGRRMPIVGKYLS